MSGLQTATNRTEDDTVFNSQAAQMTKFEPRVWSQTFRELSLSPKPGLELLPAQSRRELQIWVFWLKSYIM